MESFISARCWDLHLTPPNATPRVKWRSGVVGFLPFTPPLLRWSWVSLGSEKDSPGFQIMSVLQFASPIEVFYLMPTPKFLYGKYSATHY